MNWLLGAVVLVLVGYAIKGRQVGFIKTVFAIFSIVISLVLSIGLSPYISKTLQNNEKFYNLVNEKISEGLKLEDTDTKESKETQAIEALTLPMSLKDALIENNNSEVYKALAIKSFDGYVSGYLTVIVINAISFIITYLVIKIALTVLSRLLDIISKLPILNGLNKTAGLIVGLLQGLVVIWVLCIVLTVFGTSKIGQELFQLVNESAVLSSIYNNNLLLHVITNIAEVLF
jgi:uncharacterized membrane protein required for colicin V production